MLLNIPARKGSALSRRCGPISVVFHLWYVFKFRVAEPLGSGNGKPGAQTSEWSLSATARL